MPARKLAQFCLRIHDRLSCNSTL